MFLDEISKEQKRPNFKDGWWPHRFCSSRGEVGGPAPKIHFLGEGEVFGYTFYLLANNLGSVKHNISTFKYQGFETIEQR